MDIFHFHHFFSDPTSSRSSTWTFQLWSGPTLWQRRFSRTRYWDFPKISWFWSLLQVFCSDILDAITKDFFARKQHTPDETMHVEDIQVLEGRDQNKSTMSCFKFEVIKTKFKFPGVIECGPTRVRENIIFSVETKGRILCCALTESLDWVSGQNLKGQLVKNVMMIVKTFYVPPLQKAELRKEQRSEGSAGKQIKVKSA